MSKPPSISFEFFPPKSEKSADALFSAVDALAALSPSYMTCTYGAGGSTRDGTVDTLKKMMAHGIPLAAHLTFINSRKEELKEYTGGLWDMGVRHIVALRGDMPADADVNWPLDADENYFQYTSDFVEGLKAWNDFEISVGCYPEKHPDAPSLEADIAALKLKCDAGADRAITQFFFDNDVYFKFRDLCEAAGIDTPIVPGLLPIHDFQSMCNFAKRCQANVPDWLHEKFDGLKDRPEDAQKMAADLLVLQTEELAAQGVPHIHFYTLNKPAITDEACMALGYKKAA
ncbi:MAG: methylenetetrahydrofolate reductase [NAD(P)H] [Pseudomonadota bacterium]